ncbi:MAG: exodeoxyribonuclease V subunit gamma [Micropruina sp.]|uniref:exodeoxyribonuclease V subunit gamma n=1 Tax=Micropruina sp. TaxID=2737536 RepID=UPI0039E470D6
MTGLFLDCSDDASALADELASRLGGARPDPFALDLVVTPHAHLRRWLTNELAHRLGRPGEGICAGVRFVTPGQLLRDLGDPGRFWQPRQLAWRLLEVIAQHPDEPRLEQLRRHLAGSRSSYPVAYRLAGLFSRYLHWRPEMVARWEAGENTDEHGTDLGFDTWQPVLWRLAATAASPLAASAEFVARLRREPGTLPLPQSLSVVQPGPLSPWWLDVLDALAAHREVHVSLRRSTAVPARPASGPAARLTRFERSAQAGLLTRAVVRELPAASERPGTLGWLQRTLRGETPAAPPSDDSVQVHGGHGLERQVEILRDAITGLLAADPTLEPRDVIVGCANLTAAAPLVQAAFRLPTGVPGRHPANDFRVQLADRSSAEVNPLVGLLIQVLTLVASRATAADVIDFCAKPAVAARFGLDQDAIERLTRLAGEAGVRWGLSAPHRAGYGLDHVPQNTWTTGLQRMLLGVALGEHELPVVGTVLPLDDVEDGDLTMVGGVSELISRLSRLATDCATPAPLREWIVRLQWALDAFTLVAGDDAWQRTDALIRIADLGERGAGDEPLSLTDVTDLVSDEFERGQARSTFGNGSLTVCALHSLRGVPYRVVCLVGLDDGVFPRTPERDGDDLMLREPRPGEPDPPTEDRQALADAIMAAGDAVVIVHQSRSAQTNEPIPPPAALADLLELLEPAGVSERQHPLQPFSPSLFAHDRPQSFDPTGLRGAIAVSGPRRRPEPPTPVPPAPPLTEVGLDDLAAFVRDPVRHFLRERCGLSYWQADRLPDEIPIELDGLDRWSVGERLLGLARSGRPLDQAVRAEWLRGAVPPGALGTRLLDGLASQLGPIVESLPTSPDDPVRHHDIALDCGAVRLTGRVASQRDLVVQATFSKPSESRSVGLWLQLLALSATADGPWQAVLVGRGARRRWRGPDPATAHQLLCRWVRLYQVGLDAPLPLPLRFGARLAGMLTDSKDPFADLRDLQFAYRDDRNEQWARFYPEADDLLAVPVGADDLDQPDESVLAFAAARLIWEPIASYEAVSVR